MLLHTKTHALHFHSHALQTQKADGLPDNGGLRRPHTTIVARNDARHGATAHTHTHHINHGYNISIRTSSEE